MLVTGVDRSRQLRRRGKEATQVIGQELLLVLGERGIGVLALVQRLELAKLVCTVCFRVVIEVSLEDDSLPQRQVSRADGNTVVLCFAAIQYVLPVSANAGADQGSDVSKRGNMRR